MGRCALKTTAASLAENKERRKIVQRRRSEQHPAPPLCSVTLNQTLQTGMEWEETFITLFYFYVSQMYELSQMG